MKGERFAANPVESGQDGLPAIYARSVPRLPRLQIAGGVVHLTGRGNRRQAIFLDSADRATFLWMLDELGRVRGWIGHAYCLMPNHYHLVLETPEADLSAGMQRLNGRYAQAFKPAPCRRRASVSGPLLLGAGGRKLAPTRALPIPGPQPRRRRPLPAPTGVAVGQLSGGRRHGAVRRASFPRRQTCPRSVRVELSFRTKSLPKLRRRRAELSTDMTSRATSGVRPRTWPG